MKVSDLFDLKSGNSFELIDMIYSEKAEINFISRASTNNGVTGVVEELDGCPPFESGLITVALSGNGVCSTFVQTKPFYTAYHVMILRSKKDMTFDEKMYYAMCIKANAYRYAWGRQANKTLKDIELPDIIPEWVNSYKCNPITTDIKQTSKALEIHKWKEFKSIDFFDMYAGKYYSKDDYEIGNTAYISASDSNNGVSRKISIEPIFDGNCLTIGKVGCTTYYQPVSFCATSDVTILKPKIKFNKYIGLFVATVINQEKNKWCYGRQIRLGDCQKLVIKLPSINNEPDWSYMENYIKSLPYSDRI